MVTADGRIGLTGEGQCPLGPVKCRGGAQESPAEGPARAERPDLIRAGPALPRSTGNACVGLQVRPAAAAPVPRPRPGRIGPAAGTPAGHNGRAKTCGGLQWPQRWRRIVRMHPGDRHPPAVRPLPPAPPGQGRPRRRPVRHLRRGRGRPGQAAQPGRAVGAEQRAGVGAGVHPYGPAPPGRPLQARASLSPSLCPAGVQAAGPVRPGRRPGTGAAAAVRTCNPTRALPDERGRASTRESGPVLTARPSGPAPPPGTLVAPAGTSQARGAWSLTRARSFHPA